MESNIDVRTEYSAADNDLSAQHIDAISIIKKEIGFKSQEDIANLIASQRRELLCLKELLQVNAEEKDVLASNLKENQSEFSALKYKYEEVVLAREAQSQVQESLEERKQNELIALKAVTDKETRRIEQFMSQKLQDMEHNFQLKISENECLHLTQKCLQDEKEQLQASVHQLTKENELLQQSSNHMAKELHETDIQQSEYQSRFTRQLWEEQSAISLLQHEFEVAKAERVVLETQLASFHRIVVDSLQLVSTLNISASSLPHISKQRNQQSIMESGSLTPENLAAFSSKVDSGIGSQQPSTFQSCFSPRGDSQSPGPLLSESHHQPNGEICHGQPVLNQNIEDKCARNGHDLTVIGLDDTSCTSHYDLSLPHLGEHGVSYLEGPSSQRKVEVDGLNNLSVSQLDQTHEQSIISQHFSATFPSNIQSDLYKLHCSIRDLIESYVVAASEATQYQERLQKLEEQAASDKLALTLHVSELNSKFQQKESDLRDKQEQLAAAEAKIHELVDQVENDGSDLIEGVEDLLGAFKSNEKMLSDRKMQLEEASEFLLKKDAHIQQLEGELSAIKIDVENQIQMFGREKQEWQKSCFTSEQELECLQSKCVSAQQECAALREVNAGLRMVQEKLELNVHNQEGRINQLICDYTQQLQNKCDEISNFKDLPNQLASKDRIIESLVSEKELLVNKLYAVEHELALLKSNELCSSEKVISLSSALEEKSQVAQELQEKLHTMLCKLNEAECACLHASNAEYQTRDKLTMMQGNYKKALCGLQEKSSSLNHQLQVLRAEYMTKLNTFKKLLQSKQHELLEFPNARSETSAMQLHELSHECEGLRNKNMDLLRTIAEKDVELQLLKVHKAHLENNLTEMTDERHGVEKKYRLQLAQVEEQLTNIKDELVQQCAHSKLQQNHNDRLRAEIGSLDSKHRRKAETLKVRHKQALALQNQAHTEELADVRQKHHTVIQKMATEHDQHIRQLSVEHAEDLERQRNEMASHHAGEKAFLKMQSHETPLHLAEQDQKALDESDPAEDAIADLSDEMLLSRIMELGPLLEAEAEAVRELCCLTGQELPVENGNATPTEPLQCVIEQLQAMLYDLRNKMTASEMEDWRKELISTVEKILQHEHSKMAVMTVQGIEDDHSAEHKGDEDLIAKYQRVFQEQMASYSAQIQQLHSAERDSLVAQMRELQQTFDTMRAEQKEQITNLLSQLTEVKESSKLENQELLNQLNEVNSAHMHQLEEVLQLRAALESEGVKTAQLQLRLKEAELEYRELDTERERLESSTQTLQEELLVSRKNFDELEELAGRAATTITALEEELKASRSREAKLRGQLETHKAVSSYETYDDLERTQPSEKPADEMSRNTEELQQRLEAVQKVLSASREDASNSQQALSIKQQELEMLQANLMAQEADHKTKMEHFSQLFEKEHKANAALRNALSTREAEFQALNVEYTKLQQAHGQTFPMTKTCIERNSESAPKTRTERVCIAAGDSSGAIDVVEVKFGQLYMQYRQAELRRRSLLFQKKYLQCQLDAFYQTQQASLMMLADMGAPVDTQMTKINVLSTPRNCFKIAAIVVISIVRIRLLQRKKVKYIRSKLEDLRQKLSSSAPVSPTVTTTLSAASHSNHDPGYCEQSVSRKHQKKVQKNT